MARLQTTHPTLAARTECLPATKCPFLEITQEVLKQLQFKMTQARQQGLLEIFAVSPTTECGAPCDSGLARISALQMAPEPGQQRCTDAVSIVPYGCDAGHRHANAFYAHACMLRVITPMQAWATQHARK
jgi:hypothetical protein